MHTFSDSDQYRAQEWQLRLAILFGALLSIVLAMAILFPAQNWFLRIETFLPLHTMLEALAALMAFGIFMSDWRTRRLPYLTNLGPIGIWFLAVALLDVEHLLSYKGMPDLITPSGPNKAIYFWLAARYASAIGLLAAVYHSHPPFKQWSFRLWLSMASGYALLFSWLILFQPQAMPTMFDPNYGLSMGKIVSEWLVIALYGAAALQLAFGQNGWINQVERIWILTALWIMVLSELFFTLYRSVSDLTNLLGHVYKVISYTILLAAMYQNRRRSQQLFTHSQ